MTHEATMCFVQIPWEEVQTTIMADDEKGVGLPISCHFQFAVAAVENLDELATWPHCEVLPEYL